LRSRYAPIRPRLFFWAQPVHGDDAWHAVAARWMQAVPARSLPAMSAAMRAIRRDGNAGTTRRAGC
jgi:hypothetical protein